MNKASHILLRGVPITATSGDLRRAVMLAGVLGVTHVSIVYKRYLPVGQGVLTLSTSDLMGDALQAARKITFTGREKIIASITLDPQLSTGQRLRGVRGRVDALNRGLHGSGPSAGFPPGRSVTVVGLPGKATVHDFMPYAQGFQLAHDEKISVSQVPLPPTVFSLFARFVVILASNSEAQRLVRKLHKTPYTIKGVTRYITASVIY